MEPGRVSKISRGFPRRSTQILSIRYQAGGRDPVGAGRGVAAFMIWKLDSRIKMPNG